MERPKRHPLYNEIVAILQGQTKDWSEIGVALELFEKTSGPNRRGVIRAMGQIIREGKEPPEVVAQVIDLASGLDLAQLEPSVLRLQRRLADGPPNIVSDAIKDYLTFRQLDRRPIPGS